MTEKKYQKKIFIFTDGGSRGNPGPAALGVAIQDENENLIKEYGEFLGKKTNNEAEYEAVIFALKKTKHLFGKKKIKEIEVTIKTDSELLARQLNGEYKIENANLQLLFMKIWNLKIDFGAVNFQHVAREKNKRADRLANEILDKKTLPLF
ncbi:MAG: ribonuclease HI family protein [Candidatus Niyogibacteria bacterium]|nr:ribonuclease HI family protein [Candidatus Niyogibacteria bacterium]